MASADGVVSDQREGRGSMPCDSLGKAIPVETPNPMSRSASYSSAGVSRSASRTAPTLLENRITSAMVSRGARCRSWIGRRRPGGR